MTDEPTGLEEEPTSVDDVEEASEDEEKSETAKLKEVIDVQVEDVGTLRKKLTITVPRDAIDERLGDQFSELKRDSTVPGFRKGHAPLSLVEKRYGTEVGDQLISQLVSASYLAAVEKLDIKPLGDPLIWAKGTDGGEKLLPIDKAILEMELPSDGVLQYAAEVELRPQFELPELDGIPVDKPNVAISDEDVEGELERVRAQRGQYVPVNDGAIELDDLIIADVTMNIDGNEVANDKNVAMAARGQVIQGVVVEKLGESVQGKCAGDTVTFDATVGDDHDNLDYRGKTAAFELLIQDVKRMDVPPLDQEFVEAMGFDSVDEMRTQARTALESRLDSVIQQGLRGQIGKYLLEKCEMELPSGVSQRQTDRLVTRRKVALYQQGMAEQDIEKQMDDVRARASEESTTELKLYFIMDRVADEMEIDVHDDELNGAIASIAAYHNKRFDRVRDELSKSDGLTSLYLQLRDDKILDALLKKAVLTEVEGPKKKAAKKPAKKSAKKTAGKSAKKTSETKEKG